MFKNIIAIQREGRDIRACSILFDVPNAEFDLLTAAKAAAEDFCRTLEGKTVFDYNCSCFDWGNFAESVPNEFCRKYGFKKVENVLPDEVVEWEEMIVDDDMDD